MTAKLPTTGYTRHISSGAPLFIGLFAVLAFFVASATIAFFNIRTLQEMASKVSGTYQLIGSLDAVLSMMKDAETGQRGYLITGDEKYLDPYTSALGNIESRLEEIEKATVDNAEQHARLPLLKTQVALKQKLLAAAIALRQSEGFEAARNLIVTDRGKKAMDDLREHLAEMKEDEYRLLRELLEERDLAFRTAVQSGLVSAVAGALLAVIVTLLLRRADVARQRQDWLQAGQAKLSAKLIGELRIPVLSDNALQFLCEYLGAQAGAIFIEDEGSFRRTATYAVPSSAALPESFIAGDGLLGQAVKDARPFLVQDVPQGYLKIGSALGKNPPRHLLIAPTMIEGGVNGVVELGFFDPVPQYTLELMVRTAETLGMAVHSAKARSRIVELLEETQHQAEEVQAQSEELRVSNEELAEQSQTLQKSQAQLESQQAELEQTNLQLETQTRELEAQKDDLLEAKRGLEAQALIVERASQYKSAFLANMSHELRTPLNSSLILSQLLAENRQGNLTEEQIKYARTIQSSGNDLLALINDVLDLSKIEAGRMDLTVQRVTLNTLVDTLRGQFEPVANNRGLALRISLAPGAPQTIETDPQRLEQVLRNLLSNALKFTEKGEVGLEIASAAKGRVSFAVRDTGIGIDPEQQRIIFEPFCQADGTTSRKFGGTGLGLSISRELARLLGGEIELASKVGEGSVFKVVLPQTLGEVVAQAPATLLPPVPRPVAASAPAVSKPDQQAPMQRPAADDRDKLIPTKQVILVIEDDPDFADILQTLAHEQNFQCLVTASAHEALSLAREYLPSAVILDVGLPDGSGLFVLDRLKHDPRTRHIPVHIVSGSDYAEKALAMGAAGYMMKPVQKDMLTDAFQALEKRLTHRLRRVLVVEDDPVQLSALCSLLSSREVEPVGAMDAATCLEKLKSETFDCMVLDLSLPDASGFVLLEKISADDSYPFPPVIIYTGRELSADEEQKLRRYSKSIIVKGAKSPERLLDEVALFLHQVVAELPAEQQRMIEKARSREAALEGRRVLLAEDDVRNIFALTSLLEPMGLILEIARNGREAVEALEKVRDGNAPPIDLVLMDIMMPEMDGLAAMRAIRQEPRWQKLPIIALTAKAMPADQQQCLDAGANDYLAKPLDVEKLLSLVRVWMPR